MSEYKRRRIDMELKTFTSRHFERPSECRNPEQIRFYVTQLAKKIVELENSCSYVPSWANALLAEYNQKQNSLLHVEFRSSYC
ncbi:MAG TPA: hypothetical protein VGD65_21330 [Chryseosolibacter sp.]